MGPGHKFFILWAGAMNNSDAAEKLTEIFRLILELPDGSDVSKIKRVTESSWDSVANVELITAFESEFGVTLGLAEMERLTSYQATLLLLTEKLQ